jgi:RNA 2',3'-cyclic 3'-phosphodiesterase
VLRLFIAVPVPEHIKENLLRLKINIHGAKWTEKDQMHITLKFIGQVEGHIFNEIIRCLSDIEFEKFSVNFNGVGVFHTGNSQRKGSSKILWSGIEKSDSLKMLKNKIDAALLDCGIVRKERKYHPHVTVARLKNVYPDNITGFLSRSNTFKSVDFIVNEFILYSSILSPKGAVHNIEGVYTLL